MADSAAGPAVSPSSQQVENTIGPAQGEAGKSEDSASEAVCVDKRTQDDVDPAKDLDACDDPAAREGTPATEVICTFLSDGSEEESDGVLAADGEQAALIEDSIPPYAELLRDCQEHDERGGLESDGILFANCEAAEEEPTRFDGQWMYKGQHVANIRGAQFQWVVDAGMFEMRLRACGDGFVLDNDGQRCEAKLTERGELVWNDNQVWTRIRASQAAGGPSLSARGHAAFGSGDYAEAVRCFAEVGTDGNTTQLFHEMARLLAWEAEGIPVLRLSNFQAAVDLVAEYKKRGADVKARGCSAFRAQQFREAIPLLSEALALDPDDGITQGLLEYARLQEWERQGIPVLRMGDYTAARRLVEEHEQVDEMTMAELKQWYTKFGFPDEKGLERAEIARWLKLVKVWQTLPIAELCQECEQRNVSLRRFFLGDSEAQRTELTKQLLYAVRLEAWEARLPAKRIGDVFTVCEVVRLLEEAEGLTLFELLEWYKNLGFPEEARLQREELCNLSKQITVWQALPLIELQRECRSKGIPCELATPQPDLLEEEQSSQRGLSLINQLLIKDRMDTWERTGCYQAKRLGDPDLVMDVVFRHAEIERLSAEELAEWYEGLGFPMEKGLQTCEIASLRKKVVIWDCMPLPELHKECADKGIDTGSASSSEEEQRLRLVNALLLQDRMATWEAKGLEAQRIKKPELVFAVIREFEEIDGLSLEELKDWYLGLGFPEEQGMQKQEFVALYRKLTVWRALPSAELQEECRRKKQNVTVMNSESEEYRVSLLQKLLLQDRLSAWDAKGFQTSRINAVEDVFRAVKAYDGYVGMGDSELRKAYQDVCLSEPSGLSRAQLLRNIKTLIVWEMLPLRELQTECKERGLPCHQGLPIGNLSQRKFALVQRLRMDLQVNQVFSKEPPAEAPPPRHDATLPADLGSSSSASCESLPALTDGAVAEEQQPSDSAAPSNLEEWYREVEPTAETEAAQLLAWAASSERGDAMLLAKLVDRLGEEGLNVDDVPELGSPECTEFLEELGFAGAGDCTEVQRALCEFHAQAPVRPGTVSEAAQRVGSTRS